MTRYALFLLLMAPAVHGADEPARAVPTAAPEFFSGAYLLQVFGSLVVVIGLMFAVLWALRKFNGVGSGVGSHLKVVASVGLGQREKAVLLNAGDKQLLIGVAPGTVRTLHVFDEPVSSLQVTDPEADSPTVSFSEVWKQAVSKRGGDA